MGVIATRRPLNGGRATMIFEEWMYGGGVPPPEHISLRLWYKKAYGAGMEEKKEQCVATVQRVRSYYNESIFSPDGKTLDAKSAAWARQVCDIILEELGGGDE